MKQEILFRGKRIDNGEWIEGYYHSYSEKGETDHYVGYSNQDQDPEIIDPETVGMFSTITDKKGTKIFDGDLFKLGAEKDIFEVKFEHGCFLAYRNGKQFGLVGELQICFIDVIGNIHDVKETKLINEAV